MVIQQSRLFYVLYDTNDKRESKETYIVSSNEEDNAGVKGDIQEFVEGVVDFLKVIYNNNVKME